MLGTFSFTTFSISQLVFFFGFFYPWGLFCCCCSLKYSNNINLSDFITHALSCYSLEGNLHLCYAVTA